jgi:ParB/RepB/Spo0J family partition protein
MIIKDIDIKSISLGENIRQINKDTELNYLMQTIKDNGLLQPIGVKELFEGKYKILWGNRRLSACKKLGWRTIPATIFSTHDSEMTEEEYTIVNAIENLQQSPNTLFEIGRICTILRKTMSVTEIAVRLGISKSKVENALSEIQRIPARWQKKIKMMESGQEQKQGFIPITTAIKIVQMRNLTKNNKDKLFEHVSKNDISNADMELVASLVQKGMEVNAAIKESNKYEYASINVYCNKEKLEKALKEYPSRVDLFIACLNMAYPNLATKSIKT